MSLADYCIRLFDAIAADPRKALPDYGWVRSGAGWMASDKAAAARLLGHEPKKDGAKRIMIYPDKGRVIVHGAESAGFVEALEGRGVVRGAAFMAGLQRLAAAQGFEKFENNDHPRRDPGSSSGNGSSQRIDSKASIALSQSPAQSPAQSPGVNQGKGPGFQPEETFPPKASTRPLILEFALSWAQESWAQEQLAGEALGWLASRGINQDGAQSLNLGYIDNGIALRNHLESECFASPQELARSGLFGADGTRMNSLAGRVIFPWRDIDGQLINLIGRAPSSDTNPKSLFLAGGDKSSPLYLERIDPHKPLILVEGEMDAAPYQAAGECNVIACGGGLTANQIDAITNLPKRPPLIVLAFDGDRAGAKYTESARERLTEAGFGVTEALMPEGQDPGDLFAQEGVGALNARFDARPANAFTLRKTRAALSLLGQGLTTGVPAFDKANLRYPQASISLIAGRPGHGKTSFLIHTLAHWLSAYPEQSFLFMTYEEPEHRIVTKLFLNAAKELPVLNPGQGAMDAGASYLMDATASGYGDAAGFYDALTALETIEGEQRLYLTGEELTSDAIEARIGLIQSQAADAQRPLGGVLIDYAQKIRPAANQAQIGHERVQDALEAVRKAADTTGLPIVMGAQLRRGEGGNDASAVSLSGLRESGALEQDAALVIGLLNKTQAAASAAADLDEADLPTPGADAEVTLQVLKNRYGEAGRSANLTFKPQLFTFDERGQGSKGRVRV